jgi:preprotein translocase subunit SecA
MIERALPPVVAEYTEGAHPDEWDLVGLRQRLMLDFMLRADRLPTPDEEGELFHSRAELDEYVVEAAREAYHRKLDQFGEATDAVLRFIVLSTIDEKWKDHLYDLDHLKASIGFRGWGQKDPLVEYKKEAYDMFEDLMRDMYASVARFAFRAQLTPATPPPPPPDFFGGAARTPTPPPSAPDYSARDEVVEAEYGDALEPPAPPARPSLGINPRAAVPTRPARPTPPARPQLRTNREPEAPRAPAPVVGRNDPCPCGSGKKYKNCHGRAG